MMAIRWLEAHVKENNRQETPTREQLQELDCLTDLNPMMPWFRANMIAWLYEYAKKHMSKLELLSDLL